MKNLDVELMDRQQLKTEVKRLRTIEAISTFPGWIVVIGGEYAGQFRSYLRLAWFAYRLDLAYGWHEVPAFFRALRPWKRRYLYPPRMRKGKL